MKIDEITIMQIKNASRIEDVIADFIDLKKAGVNYKAPCPFHHEKTGSFIVSPQKNIFKCFGCGESGDAISFLMKHNNFSYPQALKYIADKYHIDIDGDKEIPKAVIKKIKKQHSERAAKHEAEAKKNEKTLKYLIELASKNDKTEADKYLQSRKLKTATYPENAFFYLNKYKDNSHGVVFFSDDKKYINKRNITPAADEPKQFSFGTLINAVYNIPFNETLDTIFVTEGAINALSIKDVGYSAIAMFATTNIINDFPKFEKYFNNKNVVIAYDFDKNLAGQKAAIKMLLLVKENFNIKSGSILIFPKSKDANDLLQEEKLKQYLDNDFNYIYPETSELKKHISKFPDKNYKPELKIKNVYSRPAVEAEEDGKFIKITEKMPDEIFKKLNVSGLLKVWALRDSKIQYVKEFTSISNRTAHTHISTLENPILTIDDKVIIRPFAKKPYKKITLYNDSKDFTYGLSLLESEYIAANKDDEEEEKKAKSKTQKLKRAIIVYNFIDFLTLKSINEYPIYIDKSLKYNLKEQILEFVYQIYQVPTNSKNILKAAKKNAVKNIEIHSYNTDKQYFSVSNMLADKGEFFFKKHLNTALPLKFWEWDKQKRDFDLNIITLRNFLNKYGYFTHESLREKSGYMYVKINGKAVEKIDKEIFPRHIETMIDRYLRDRGESVKLRNKISISNRFSEKNLSGLEQIELDFDNSGPDFQNFFFADGNMWTVTKKGITVSPQSDMKKYVWREELLEYPSEIQKAPFEIFYQTKYKEILIKIKKAKAEKNEKELKKAKAELHNYRAIDKWDIKINDRSNYFLQYLFATSYAYFEKAEAKGYFAKPSDFWYEMPKDLLSIDEINEIKLHLINKITWLGYYIKDYRQPADDYGLAILDAIDELPGSYQRGAAGGGKSLITKALREIKRVLIIKAEREDFAEYAHRYADYENERIIVCDDMHLKSRIGNMLTDFSDGIYINPKHKKVITIPFLKSPKIIITRNFIDDEGERVDRRLGRMFVFPFFHDNKSERFKQRRKPADWFKRMLYKDDTEQDKSNLINFFAYAYIANRHIGEVNPPMSDMQKYRLSKRIGEPLIDFLDTYFADDDNFGYIDRVPFYKQFLEEQRFKMNTWHKTKTYSSAHKFKTLVADYCKIRGYIFNPSELFTDQNRIRRLSSTQEDANGMQKYTEHFWIHNKKATNEEINRKANSLTAAIQEVNDNDFPAPTNKLPF